MPSALSKAFREKRCLSGLCLFRLQVLANVFAQNIGALIALRAERSNSTMSYVTADSLEALPPRRNGGANMRPLELKQAHDDSCTASRFCRGGWRGKALDLERPCGTIDTSAGGRQSSSDQAGAATNLIGFLWSFCHSLDATVALKVKSECMQLESSCLKLTIEDLAVFVGLE